MGKYSELYRKLTDLVRSGEVDGQEPKEILETYPDYAKMNMTTFRGKLRQIRQMLGKIPKKGKTNMLTPEHDLTRLKQTILIIQLNSMSVLRRYLLVEVLRELE